MERRRWFFRNVVGRFFETLLMVFLEHACSFFSNVVGGFSRTLWFF